MRIKTINKLIGYGVLMFLLKLTGDMLHNEYLQLFLHPSAVLTFTGIFFFFKDTNLWEQFYKHPSDDWLTYFWNVIALKMWTFMAVIGIVAEYLEIFFPGYVRTSP